MAFDIQTIGTFGISFSRGLDQTWLNLIRKDDGFKVEFYQNVEDEDSEEEDEIIDTSKMISAAEGEAVLRRAFEDGGLESWQVQYTKQDSGTPTDLNWTIDIDDPNDADLLMFSGNGMLPPEEQIRGVVTALRGAEERFLTCFREFR